MSPSSPGWTVIGVLLAAVSAALLIRRARRGDPASRWFAVVAVVWGAAFAAQGASAGEVTPAVVQLTLTDLLALLGLPPLVLGLLRLAPPAGRDRQHRRRGVSDPGRLVDAGLLVLSVFSIGWVAILRSAYTAAAVGPGMFSVDLIHPAADLVVLGGTLWLAIRAGRRALMPYLALWAATLGDFLAVQARASGIHPGSWPQLAWLVAFCLLGASALTGPAEASNSAAGTRSAAPGQKREKNKKKRR